MARICDGCITADCTAIASIASKFDVTEDQVRGWAKRPYMGRKVTIWYVRFPTRGEAWYYRIRNEMLTGGGKHGGV